MSVKRPSAGHVPSSRRWVSPSVTSTVIFRGAGVKLPTSTSTRTLARLRSLSAWAAARKDGQVRQRLACGGRFGRPVDHGVGGQGGEVGLGPTRPLKIAEDDQFPPPRLSCPRSARASARPRSKAALTSSRSGRAWQRESSSRSVSKFVDGPSNTGRGVAPARIRLAHRPGSILQVWLAAKVLAWAICCVGADGRAHALADVDQHDPHGVARLVVGGQRLRSPAAAGPRPGPASPRPASAGRGSADRGAGAGPPLVDRFADEAQRGERHPHGPGLRQPSGSPPARRPRPLRSRLPRSEERSWFFRWISVRLPEAGGFEPGRYRSFHEETAQGSANKGWPSKRGDSRSRRPRPTAAPSPGARRNDRDRSRGSRPDCNRPGRRLSMPSKRKAAASGSRSSSGWTRCRMMTSQPRWRNSRNAAKTSSRSSMRKSLISSSTPPPAERSNSSRRPGGHGPVVGRGTSVSIDA